MPDIYRFAWFPSSRGGPSVPVDDLERAGVDVVIIGAPIDGGTTHLGGARFGPKAIRDPDHLGAERMAGVG